MAERLFDPLDIVPTCTREQAERAQARVYECVPAEDVLIVMSALFQPPRPQHHTETGRRLYGRD